MIIFKIDFEAVPMGFETAEYAKKTIKIWILKQSLWDLKHNL